MPRAPAWLFALTLLAACGPRAAGSGSALPPPRIDQLIDSAAPHWPMFRHGQLRRGTSPQFRLGAPGLVWTYEIGAEILSSPVIDAEGTIYVGAFDGALYAIDKQGRLRWRFETMAAIWSTPAIARDGTVYVASIDHHVYAVRDGKLAWVVKLGNCAFSSPLLDRAGNVYIASNDTRVHAIAPDGSARWSTRVGAPVDASVTLSPWGQLFVGTTSGRLVALDLAGQVVGQLPVTGGIRSTAAIADDGTVVFAADDGAVYAARGGRQAWKFQTRRPVWSSPAIGPDGTVYIGSDDGALYALDLNGGFTWHFQTQGPVRSSPTVTAGGVVYFGSQDANLYAVGADGTLVWAHTTGGPIDASPAIGAFGEVVIASRDGRVYAFR